jgi:hypothetical protein
MASSTAAQPQRPPRRELDDFVQLRRSPLHSYYRQALCQAGVSPLASFPHKLSAFTMNRIGWVVKYLQYLCRRQYKFQDYTDCAPGDECGVYDLGRADQPIKVAIAGDWGTGTAEASEVAQHMQSGSPHFTIHLGDVYYVGDPEEIQENCLGQEDAWQIAPVRWSKGSVGSFALNGNHEMYADGFGYFRVFLPQLGVPASAEGRRFGQKASFFCLRNRYWQIIALDTGYNSKGFPILGAIPGIQSWPGIRPSCKLEKPSLDWLSKCLAADRQQRATILLTHHQYFSNFEDSYPRPATQIAQLFNAPLLWFWGHEHRFAIYGKHSKSGGVEAYGRCLGNGGMPVTLTETVRDDAPLVAYDARVYQTLGDLPVGFNGFAVFNFEGPTLTIEYRDKNDHLMLSEKWASDQGRPVGLEIAAPPNVLRIKAPLENAIR